MLDKETVELWILEHACKFCLPAVFKAAWRRCGGLARHGVLPDIYLAMMDLHLAVSGDLAQLSAETVAALERGQQLMEKIFSCDRRLSTHAHLVAKTIISMRIKVLFWYLGGTRSEALAKMNYFFPREGLPLLEKLCPSQAHLVIEFRRFFLPLLAHEESRVSYMQTDYKQEYGPAFNQHLQSRTQRFLAILQSLLPATPIEQIMSGNGHAVLGSPEGSQECVTMEMVMQCLSGVHGNASRATVQALLDLLTMVSPLNPLERPPIHPHLLLQSQSQTSQPSEETPCPDSETLDNFQVQTDTVPPVPNSDPSVPKSSAPVAQSVTPGPATVPSAPAVGTTPPQSARQDQRRKDSSRSTHGASGGVVTRSRSRQETVDRVHAGRRKNTVPATAARKKQLPAIQQRVSLRRKILSKQIPRGGREVQEKRLLRSLRKKSSTEKTAAVVVTDSDATVSGVAAAEEGVRRSARLMRKRGAEGEQDDNASADDIIDKGPSTSSGESTSLIRCRVPPR